MCKENSFGVIQEITLRDYFAAQQAHMTADRAAVENKRLCVCRLCKCQDHPCPTFPVIQTYLQASASSQEREEQRSWNNGMRSNKWVFSKSVQRDVATEVGCSARLASAQPMERCGGKPPIRIRRFRTKECCTAFDYMRAGRLQEKDAPRVRVENYSTCRLTVAGKKATILLSLF